MLSWISLVLALLAQAPAAPPILPLEAGWRWHAGDDAGWAEPGYDDSRWSAISVPGAWERAAPGYDGFGWYRRSVTLPPELETGPLGVRLGSVGDSFEMYWNGVRIAGRGAFPPRFVEGVTPALVLVPHWAIALRPGGPHVVAVRVYNDYAYGGLLGGVRLGRYDALATRFDPGEMIIGGLTSFFLAIGVYHLAFFLRRRRARENLHFALLCGLAALYGAAIAPLFAQWTIHLVNPYRVRLLALLLAGPVYLHLLARLFDLRLGRPGRAVGWAMLAATPVVALLPLAWLAELHRWISLALGVGLVVSVAWLFRCAVLRTPYARLLVGGAAALAAAVVWDLLSEHQAVPVARVLPGVPGLFWLGFLAFVVAVGIATASSFAEAEVHARMDPLTGLVRRHVFEDALTREAERRRRSGGMLTLLIIDLDHFKRVNDTHGHRVGDEVLARVGHLLRHNARNIDLTCRLGGEEFAVLLSDTDVEGAHSFIHRFRQRLADLEIPTPAGGVADLTASVGIVVSTGFVETQSLLESADGAMYEAKRTGRNRVVTVSLPVGWPGRGTTAA